MTFWEGYRLVTILLVDRGIFQLSPNIRQTMPTRFLFNYLLVNIQVMSFLTI